MSSGSERALSLEELRQRNMPQQLSPDQHPTEQNWLELSAALEALGQLLAEQNLTLEELAGRSYRGPTPEQITESRKRKPSTDRWNRLGKRKSGAFRCPGSICLSPHGNGSSCRRSCCDWDCCGTAGPRFGTGWRDCSRKRRHYNPRTLRPQDAPERAGKENRPRPQRG